MNPETMASVVVFAWLLAALVVLLWILLPFAVFGIKRRLDTLIELERTQLENLRRIRRHVCEETDDDAR